MMTISDVMSWVGVAHNFAPKFDYDTKTTTGVKFFLCWRNIDISLRETTREMPNLERRETALRMYTEKDLSTTESCFVV